MSILRVSLGQLRFRRARAVALTLVLLGASAGFLLLSAAGKTTDVRVKGSVRSAFRPAYDILVRPQGSATPLERSAGLVRSNYLSGIYGGITLEQWESIKRIHGVAVAAPVANIGYVLPWERIKIGIKRDLNRDPVQLYRVNVSYVTPDGSRYPSYTPYVYYTRVGRYENVAKWTTGEVVPGKPGYTEPCGGWYGSSFNPTYGPFDPAGRSSISCFAEGSKTNSFTWSFVPRDPRYANFVGVETGANFPVAVSAIDPASEAKLLHLDRAIVGGRYLKASDEMFVRRQPPPKYVNPDAPSGHMRFQVPLVPVIASSRTFLSDKLQVEVERLRIPRGTDAARALTTGTCKLPRYPCAEAYELPKGADYHTGRQFAEALKGAVVERRTEPVLPLYERIVGGVSDPSFAPWKGLLPADGFWTASPVRYRTDRKSVV